MRKLRKVRLDQAAPVTAARGGKEGTRASVVLRLRMMLPGEAEVRGAHGAKLLCLS